MKKTFGQITVETISIEFDYQDVFESNYFWASRNSIDDTIIFEACLEKDIILWNCIPLNAQGIYQETFDILTDNLSMIEKKQKLPKKVLKCEIHGKQDHKILGFLAAAWLLSFGFSVNAECNLSSGIADIASKDRQWIIECGNTESRKTLKYLRDKDCFVGIIPFISFEDKSRYIMHIFQRGKNWSVYEEIQKQKELQAYQEFDKASSKQFQQHKQLMREREKQAKQKKRRGRPKKRQKTRRKK